MLISHWCKLLDGLQASPQEFYSRLHEAIAKRQVPQLATSRVLMPEGGLFSSRREYVRLTREHLKFDICAAPFGAGFLVSCRLSHWQFPWLLVAVSLMTLVIAGVMGIVLLVFLTKGLLAAGSVLFMFTPFVIGLGVVLFGSLWLGKMLLDRFDAYIAATPAIAAIVERVLGRLTYYRIDQVCAFQEAVHAALMEVVDGYTKTAGLSPLSEFERKPVFNPLFKS